ncbi:hypothetical protein [Methanomethylovorans sp.]|uniref:hypothetical protein n=1 Tax=Methanomethylovorans sp. TaxID=2758717 RepID=UPI00345E7444
MPDDTASAAFSYSGFGDAYIKVNGTLDVSPFEGILAFFRSSILNPTIGYTPANERFEGVVTNQKFIDKYGDSTLEKLFNKYRNDGVLSNDYKEGLGVGFGSALLIIIALIGLINFLNREK